MPQPMTCVIVMPVTPRTFKAVLRASNRDAPGKFVEDIRYDERFIGGFARVIGSAVPESIIIWCIISIFGREDCVHMKYWNQADVELFETKPA